MMNGRYSDLRKGRVSVTGTAYHVVFSTKHRQPEFSNFTQARQIVRYLKTDSQLNNTQTLAFVVMPDHVHWL